MRAMMNKFNHWFKSNILSEYLPMLLIVLVIIIGASYLPEKDVSSATKDVKYGPITSESFKCPKEYSTEKEYLESIDKFADYLLKQNPRITTDEAVAERVKWFTSKECEKGNWSYENIQDKYHCPKYYETKEEYLQNVDRFIADYKEINPQATDPEALANRYVEVEAKCGYPPIWEIILDTD